MSGADALNTLGFVVVVAALSVLFAAGLRVRVAFVSVGLALFGGRVFYCDNKPLLRFHCIRVEASAYLVKHAEIELSGRKTLFCSFDEPGHRLGRVLEDPGSSQVR